MTPERKHAAAMAAARAADRLLDALTPGTANAMTPDEIRAMNDLAMALGELTNVDLAWRRQC